MEQTIAYRFGPDDYIAMLRASRSIGPLGRFGRWGRAALFGVLIGGLVIVFSYDTLLAAPGLVLPAAAIVAALVTAVAPIGEFLAERLMARWLFPRYSVANKDVTLELGEQDIRSRSEGSEGRISWRSIIRVIETKDGLFLALSRAELIQVPRRALPSAAAFADLAGQVRAKVAASIAGQ
jgi:YcxB-like protein